MRDVVLADHDLDVDAGIADEAEDLDDAALREMGGAIGIAVDLHVDHLPFPRVHGLVDEDVVVDAHVERHDVRLGVEVEPPHHRAMRAAEDLHHLAVDELAVADAAYAGLLLVDADDHEVAVHGTFQRLAVDVDLGLALTSKHRAVAVVVNLDRAGVVRRELEQRVTLAADRDDGAVALQLFDHAVDFILRDVLVGQALVDFLASEEAVAALAQKLDDGLVELGAVGDSDGARQIRVSCLARRARRLAGAGDGGGNALVRDAAAHRAHRLGEAVQHRLRAELVVERVPVHTELARGLGDVALAGRHGRNDVLAFERFDRLFQGDAIANQLANDGVQAIVDAYHFDLDLSGVWCWKDGILLLKIRVTGRKIFLQRVLLTSHEIPSDSTVTSVTSAPIKSVNGR
jgi:hypothetical protein